MEKNTKIIVSVVSVLIIGILIYNINKKGITIKTGKYIDTYDT